VSDLLSATAEVATDAPARYAKQLVSHFGRKAEVRTEADGDRLVLGVGSCLVSPAGDVLRLVAESDSPQGLDRVEHVVGSHLERFGARNELVVRWEQAV
jgi:hypothetical protein